LINVLRNPGFEDGLDGWYFFASGGGAIEPFANVAGHAHGARLVIQNPGDNVQLCQFNVVLEPDVNYVLTFSALSSRGSDVEVSLYQDAPPYNSYGISVVKCDIGQEWSDRSIPFRTASLSSSVNDARLEFWLAPYATAGEEYLFDDIRLSKVVTATAEDRSTSYPETPALDWNFPNPFNPTTVVRYTVPKRMQIALRVYDVLGRMVASLAEGPQEAGHHEVAFHGSSLPSGVYICRLDGERFSHTMKMILLK
jgi:hypothetical protein